MALSIPRYTVDDLERFPEDGNRYELLDGMLIVTPFPEPVHQVAAMELKIRIWNALTKPGFAEVLGPAVVTRPPDTQLQPDILVYPIGSARIRDWTDITEHWLAVEILESASRVYDREFKRDAYFALGVQAVWLVDIEDRSVEVWRARTEHEVVRDVIRWSAPTTDVVVTIDLVELFAELD
jgi:Uma2 family endonuclease